MIRLLWVYVFQATICLSLLLATSLGNIVIVYSCQADLHTTRRASICCCDNRVSAHTVLAAGHLCCGDTIFHKFQVMLISFQVLFTVLDILRLRMAFVVLGRI